MLGHAVCCSDSPHLARGVARRTAFMLNPRIEKLATSALVDIAVMAIKTAWKPFVYASRIAIFLGSVSAMLRRTKI